MVLLINKYDGVFQTGRKLEVFKCSARQANLDSRSKRVAEQLASYKIALDCDHKLIPEWLRKILARGEAS